MEHVAALLARTAIFARLPETELLRVARLAARESVEAGAVLARSQERATDLYIVERGVVRVSVLSARDAGEGEQAAIVEPHDLLTAGDVVGWSALVEPYLSMATATAATACRLLRIPAHALLDVLHECPEAGLDVIAEVAAIARKRYVAVVAHAAGRASDCPFCP